MNAQSIGDLFSTQKFNISASRAEYKAKKYQTEILDKFGLYNLLSIVLSFKKILLKQSH